MARNMRSTARSTSVTRSIAPFFDDLEGGAQTRHLDVAGAQDGFDRGREEEGIGHVSGEPFEHPDFHAALGRPLNPDVVHEAAHEEDAASARLQDVLGRQGVGQGVGIEPVAVVAYADGELGRRGAGRHGEIDFHLLRGS